MMSQKAGYCRLDVPSCRLTGWFPPRPVSLG
jgi:hypothetical protein